MVPDGECPYGCEQCSPINGCVACKPPFFLLLHREGIRQTASCTRSCPPGFYKLRRNKKKKRGFCAKCLLRGCSECSTRHYCSECMTGLVRHAGRCRKRCPPGTQPSPRAPGLCLSSPSTPAPDLEDNEIATKNSTWPQVETSTSSQETNTTSLPPPTTTKNKRKKLKKDKGKKRERHRRRKHKRIRERNRRRKERRRRRRLRKLRERRRKKMTSATALNATTTTTTTTTAAAATTTTTTTASTTTATTTSNNT